MMELLKISYMILCIVCSVLAGLFSTMETDYERNILKLAFYVQRQAWNVNADDINTIGLCIIIFFITLFVWPANLTLLVILIFIKLFGLIWKSFKYLFRKRKDNHD